jgi:hypothetical protein
MAKANQNKSISAPKVIGDSEGQFSVNPSGNGGQPQTPAPPKSDAPIRQEPFQQLPPNLVPGESASDKMIRDEKLTNENYPRRRGGRGNSDVGR